MLEKRQLSGTSHISVSSIADVFGGAFYVPEGALSGTNIIPHNSFLLFDSGGGVSLLQASVVGCAGAGLQSFLPCTQPSSSFGILLRSLVSTGGVHMQTLELSLGPMWVQSGGGFPLPPSAPTRGAVQLNATVPVLATLFSLEVDISSSGGHTSRIQLPIGVLPAAAAQLGAGGGSLAATPPWVRTLHLQGVSASQEQTHVFHVESSPDVEWSLLALSPPDWLQLVPATGVQPGMPAATQVRMSLGGLPPGRYRHTVMLLSNSTVLNAASGRAVLSTLPAPVTVEVLVVQGGVLVDPPSIHHQHLPGSSRASKVFISNPSEIPMPWRLQLPAPLPAWLDLGGQAASGLLAAHTSAVLSFRTDAAVLPPGFTGLLSSTVRVVSLFPAERVVNVLVEVQVSRLSLCPEHLEATLQPGTNAVLTAQLSTLVFEDWVLQWDTSQLPPWGRLIGALPAFLTTTSAVELVLQLSAPADNGTAAQGVPFLLPGVYLGSVQLTAWQAHNSGVRNLIESRDLPLSLTVLGGKADASQSSLQLQIALLDDRVVLAYEVASDLQQFLDGSASAQAAALLAIPSDLQVAADPSGDTLAPVGAAAIPADRALLLPANAEEGAARLRLSLRDMQGNDLRSAEQRLPAASLSLVALGGSANTSGDTLLSTPASAVLLASIQAFEEGGHTVELTPQGVGVVQLSVFVGGDHVHGSPILVHVTQAICSSPTQVFSFDQTQCLCAPGYEKHGGDLSDPSRAPCLRCAPGFVRETPSNSVECAPCPNGFIASTAGDRCDPCPVAAGAICTRGVLRVREGYWCEKCLVDAPTAWTLQLAAMQLQATGSLPNQDSETARRRLTNTSTSASSSSSALSSAAVSTFLTRANLSSSDAVLRCFNQEACVAVGGGVAMQCAQGYNGPLCAACQDGFAMSVRSRCKQCWDVRLAAGALMLALLLLVAAVLWYALRAPSADELNRADGQSMAVLLAESALAEAEQRAYATLDPTLPENQKRSMGERSRVSAATARVLAAQRRSETYAGRMFTGMLRIFTTYAQTAALLLTLRIAPNTPIAEGIAYLGQLASGVPLTSVPATCTLDEYGVSLYSRFFVLLALPIGCVLVPLFFNLGSRLVLLCMHGCSMAAISNTRTGILTVKRRTNANGGGGRSLSRGGTGSAGSLRSHSASSVSGGMRVPSDSMDLDDTAAAAAAEAAAQAGTTDPLQAVRPRGQSAASAHNLALVLGTERELSIGSNASLRSASRSVVDVSGQGNELDDTATGLALEEPGTAAARDGTYHSDDSAGETEQGWGYRARAVSMGGSALPQQGSHLQLQYSEGGKGGEGGVGSSIPVTLHPPPQASPGPLVSPMRVDDISRHQDPSAWNALPVFHSQGGSARSEGGSSVFSGAASVAEGAVDGATRDASLAQKGSGRDVDLDDTAPPPGVVLAIGGRRARAASMQASATGRSLVKTSSQPGWSGCSDGRSNSPVDSLDVASTRAAVILLYLVWASVTTAALHILDIHDEKIYGEYRLRRNMNYSTGDELYPFVSYCAYAALVLYTLGLPVAGTTLLWCNRHRIASTSMRRRYGLLYLSYYLDPLMIIQAQAHSAALPPQATQALRRARRIRQRAGQRVCGQYLWLWEGCVMARKALLAVVSVLVLQPTTQSQLVIAVLIVAIVAHLALKPYDSALLNTAEAVALFTLAASQMAAVVLASDDQLPTAAAAGTQVGIALLNIGTLVFLLALLLYTASRRVRACTARVCGLRGVDGVESSLEGVNGGSLASSDLPLSEGPGPSVSLDTELQGALSLASRPTHQRHTSEDAPGRTLDAWAKEFDSDSEVDSLGDFGRESKILPSGRSAHAGAVAAGSTRGGRWKARRQDGGVAHAPVGPQHYLRRQRDSGAGSDESDMEDGPTTGPIAPSMAGSLLPAAGGGAQVLTSSRAVSPATATKLAASKPAGATGFTHERATPPLGNGKWTPDNNPFSGRKGVKGGSAWGEEEPGATTTRTGAGTYRTGRMQPQDVQATHRETYRGTARNTDAGVPHAHITSSDSDGGSARSHSPAFGPLGMGGVRIFTGGAAAGVMARDDSFDSLQLDGEGGEEATPVRRTAAAAGLVRIADSAVGQVQAEPVVAAAAAWGGVHMSQVQAPPPYHEGLLDEEQLDDDGPWQPVPGRLPGARAVWGGDTPPAAAGRGSKGATGGHRRRR